MLSVLVGFSLRQTAIRRYLNSFPTNFVGNVWSRPTRSHWTSKALLSATAGVSILTPAAVELDNVAVVQEEEEEERGDSDQNKMRNARKIDQPGTVLLFAGQGTQHVGMGAVANELPTAKSLFDVASEVLGYDLLELCQNGPEEKLNSTRHSQPAIFVCSLASIEQLKVENPTAVNDCIAAAGYSVGEYAALVFGGALAFKSAIHLVKIRASLMQNACEQAPSGMLTVRLKASADLDAALRAARLSAQKHGVDKPVCQVASSLYTQCKVIGGNDEALQFIMDKGGEFGIIPVKRVEVSGAFHTPLMESASNGLRRALHMVKFSKPSINVYSNVFARPYASSVEIPESLTVQICKEVKWEQIMHNIYDKPQSCDHQLFPVTYETGPGDHLGKMLKRCNAKAFANYHRL